MPLPDSSEVCKQCTECGATYGHRKRTKEIVTWAKKKQRYIRREELIAFLLDKPYLENSSSDKLDDFHCELPIVGQKQLTTPTSAIVPPGLGFQSQCGSFMTTSPLPSPSPNRRRALLNKEEASVLESEHFTFGVSGRKRQASGSMCSSSGLSFDFSSTIGSEAPLPKRMRLWYRSMDLVVATRLLYICDSYSFWRSPPYIVTHTHALLWFHHEAIKTSLCTKFIISL